MTLRRNDEIQTGIVSYLKSKTVITSLLYSSDPAEIKEDQWQGTTSHYPNVRVRMINNMPNDVLCHSSRYSVGIQVFSELDSSREADKIAGIIMGVLHGKGFTSAGIAFTSTVTNVIPAISQDVRTWRAEVLVNGIAS